MILDFHCHIFPEAIAERAMDSLSESFGDLPIYGDGTLENLLGVMDESGVEIACIANIATKPAQARAILEWSRTIRSPRIIPFGSIHPKSADYVDEIAAFKEAGFPAVKLHPMYQNFNLDDQWVLPLFRELERSGLTVLLHGGRDIAYPGADNASPRRFRKLLERVPSLKVVAAHLGGWESWREVLSDLAGANCWFDSSFISQVEPALRDAILEKHGVDRIVYGSDFPWQSQTEQIDCIQGLGLSENELESLLCGTAKELLGLAER